MPRTPRTPEGAPDRVRSVLVLADGDKEGVRALLAELEPWLARRVEKVVVEPDVRAFEARAAAGSTRASAPDLALVLGGDGAILSVVRALARDPVPTLGINFGRLGFLAAADTRRWREALEAVLDGRAVLEPRLRIEAEMDGAKEKVRALALNDVVVTRGAFQGMLTLSLVAGGEWVTLYRADGLIVATPSGSTAYSMAAGGPILAPSLSGFVVTPICPQALSYRAIVLDAARELVLEIKEATSLATLVVDGQGFYPMHERDRVVLRRHPVPYPLLALPDFDYYRRLRERLGWRGTVGGEEPPART